MAATTARQRAIANESREIETSQQRAIASREIAGSAPRRMSALESMSLRLGVTQQELQDSLVATVFAGCRSKAEFLALVVVANEYKLNPLTKEIYAFPSKGGGVVPMVSVDGWITLMNSHPQFDGIEFDYHTDAKGNIEAIESIIYRKDRSRPIKVIEYLEECERPTDPWRKTKRRMLRHRALIQGVRVAFGFSGIYAPDDEDVVEASYQVVPQQAVPSMRSIGEELDDEIPNFDARRNEAHDPQTGEVIQYDNRGMSEVDEETACQLDAGSDGTFDEQENPTAEEGPMQEQRGEQTEDEPVWLGPVRELRKKLANAKTVKAVRAIENDWTNRIMNGVPDEGVVRSVDNDIVARKRELSQAEG